MSNPVTEEIELAIRLMDSDESVLDEILIQFGSSILGFLVAKYPSFNHHGAEDVLSIAVSKLWDSRANYDDSRGSLRSYLFKIADNTARDIFKVGWHKARALASDWGDNNRVDLIPDASPPAEETKSQRKTRDRKRQKELSDLQRVIDVLPEKERVIILSDAYAKGRVSDSAKLADELGIAVGSVRGYRSRAWKSIRTKMKALGHELPPER